jgi:hypothetical protein
MIALLDTSEDLEVCEAELGAPVGQLLTPLTGFNLQYPDRPKAIDNGAFKRLLVDRFLALLKREQERRTSFLFVAVPDVPYSARRTLEVFEHWRVRKELHGWPLALVAQNGQEDLLIPWDLIQAIFIGGDDKFKDGIHAEAIIKAAKALGKWVHVGRCNTPGRFEKFESLGADSIDGSGLSRYSWMRERIYKAATSPRLFNEELACV